MGKTLFANRGMERRIVVMGLEIATTRVGQSLVFALQGELDVYKVGRFSAAVDGVNASAPVVVDLSGVDLVDSSGLAALMRLSHRVRPTLCCSQSLVRVLTITGLLEQFDIAGPDGEPRTGPPPLPARF